MVDRVENFANRIASKMRFGSERSSQEASEVVFEKFRKKARDLYAVRIANGRTEGTRVPLLTKVTKCGLDS
jgi:hypothetical protein